MGVSTKRRRKGRREQRRGRGRGSGTAAREAEAAYQAVSCGDKQSPEVIGVHAACLFLLEDAGTAGGQAPSRQRGHPVCTAGKQDSGRSGGDRGGPKRPGKGKGSRETRVGRRQESQWDGTHSGGGWNGEGGETERRREREKSS